MERHHAKEAAEIIAQALAQNGVPPHPAAARRIAQDLMKLDLPKPDYRPMQRWFGHLAAAVRTPRNHRQ